MSGTPSTPTAYSRRAEHRVGDDLAGVAHDEGVAEAHVEDDLGREARVAASEDRDAAAAARGRARCGARRPGADAAARRRRSARCRDAARATWRQASRDVRSAARSRRFLSAGSIQRWASMVGTRAVASVSNSSGVAVPSSTNVLPPASVVRPYCALPTSSPESRLS